MAVTINQIAEMAGVSKGTVDRVLNNRGKVSPEVEKRVRIIAKELNYKPNIMAKSLAIRKRAPKIGVIFHVKSRYFTNQVVKGLQEAEEELADYGISLIIQYCGSGNAEEQIRLIDGMLENDIAAIAITPINDKSVADKIDELLEKKYPIFCFINDIQTVRQHVFVGNDAYQTGRLAGGVLGLIAGEKEKLAILTPELKMLGHIDRIRGIQDAIKERKLDVACEELCEIPFNDIEIYKTVKQYFEKHPDITSVWYATTVSDGGITAMRELGLLYNIKILCIDLQDFIREGLREGYIAATIDQDPFNQGYEVIKQMFSYLLTGEQKQMFYKVNSRIVLKENIE